MNGRPFRSPGIGILVLLWFFLSGTPSSLAGQSAANGWNVQVLLDGSRQLNRRIRVFLLRDSREGLRAPILGSRFFSGLAGWSTIADWPGLDPHWVGEGPHLDSLSGEPVPDPDAIEIQKIRGQPHERIHRPEFEATEWRLPGNRRPAWTVSYRDEGHPVLALEPPGFIPLIPDRIDLSTEGTVWVLHHAESGQVSWALGAGSVGGPGSLSWMANWTSRESDWSGDVHQALDRVPNEILRHGLAEYRPFETWRPMESVTGALSSLRFNRVEGGSVALPVFVNLTSTLHLGGWARLSTSSFPLQGGGGITLDRWPATWGIEGYRRLEDANRWEPAERKRGNSLMAFLYGQDDGHYYDAEGLSLWAERSHGLTTWRVELFRETDRTARLRTDYSLFTPDSMTLGPGLEAENGDFGGIRVDLEHQRGLDLEQGVVVTSVWMGATSGDRDYFKGGAMVDALRSWGWWAVGIRTGGGWILGDAPIQREYFLGGATSVRGVPPATLQGPVMALGRLEMGFGPPASRLIGFGDIGWAGESGRLARGASAGIGLSLMEGLVRLDLAFPLQGAAGAKLYVTGNGLL